MGKIERYRGSLLVLAVGDALGTALEFKAPGSFKPNLNTRVEWDGEKKEKKKA